MSIFSFLYENNSRRVLYLLQCELRFQGIRNSSKKPALPGVRAWEKEPMAGSVEAALRRLQLGGPAAATALPGLPHVAPPFLGYQLRYPVPRMLAMKGCSRQRSWDKTKCMHIRVKWFLTACLFETRIEKYSLFWFTFGKKIFRVLKPFRARLASKLAKSSNTTPQKIGFGYQKTQNFMMISNLLTK